MRLLLLFAILSLAAHAQEYRKVAVFDPEGSVEKPLLEIVREEISSVVVNTSGYTVLERQLINKVLEENKFQESGLVSDAQVSDIGKRMGADFVFVTTISTLGENYYISCKMIEVTTARIDKQFTGTTTDGINDIPQTTQYIVKRLFGENVKQQVFRKTTSKPEEVSMSEERSKQAAEPVQAVKRWFGKNRLRDTKQKKEEPAEQIASENRQAVKTAAVEYGAITTNGKNVYSYGMKLKREEIQSMFNNSDALNYYNTGISQRKNANLLIWGGVAAFIVGSGLSSAMQEETYNSYTDGRGTTYKEYGYRQAYGYMVLGAIAGLGLSIPGFILKSKAKKSVRLAVDIYNSSNNAYYEQPSSLRFDFGLTASGSIGLTVTF